MKARTLVGLALLPVAVFVALGSWQLERRASKLELIERVDARINLPPVAPPGADVWPAINAQDDEYRRIRLRGRFLFDRETRVRATTELGAGYWVMTPLRTADGTLVLVNRGFVSADWREPATGRTATQESVVTGLLRLSERPAAPLKWLRRNDPGTERWYWRDVAAIAQARGLARAAPYFIDAERSGDAPPVGGLTVVRFRNNHLVYAFTWYALAVLSSWGVWRLYRETGCAGATNCKPSG